MRNNGAPPAAGSTVPPFVQAHLFGVTLRTPFLIPKPSAHSPYKSFLASAQMGLDVSDTESSCVTGSEASTPL